MTAVLPTALVRPSDDPTVISVTFPARSDLASVAQMLVGAVEMNLWRDTAELISLRRVIHEVACHLDRTASNGAEMSVRIEASAGLLDVQITVPVASDEAQLDRWVRDLADEAFDEVRVQQRGSNLMVSLRSNGTVPDEMMSAGGGT